MKFSNTDQVTHLLTKGTLHRNKQNIRVFFLDSKKTKKQGTYEKITINLILKLTKVCLKENLMYDFAC